MDLQSSITRIVFVHPQKDGEFDSFPGLLAELKAEQQEIKNWNVRANISKEHLDQVILILERLRPR